MDGMKARLFALAAVAVFGLFLLKGVTTGFVVSESCCTPQTQGCVAEKACPFLQQPAVVDDSSVVGFLILLTAGALVVGEVAWRRQRRKGKEGMTMRVV